MKPLSFSSFLLVKFFCPMGKSENCKDFKTMQKAGAAAHSESPGTGTWNLRPVIAGCRWVQHSHHLLMCKIKMAEIREQLPFPDRVDGRGNSAILRNSESGSTATASAGFPQCWSNQTQDCQLRGRVSMKCEVHGDLIQCPCQGLPDNL